MKTRAQRPTLPTRRDGIPDPSPLVGGSSWWMGLGRTELQAEATRRFTRDAKPTHLQLNHKGRFGDCAF